jgi:sialate O-acetylesterase
LARVPEGAETEETFVKETANYKVAFAKYEEEAAAAEKNHTKKPNPPFVPHKPSELYNGMIAPIIPYAIKGAIWYQGENNAPRASQYRSLFPNMIRDWRKRWEQGDFTFCCVQLAPFRPIQAQPGESDWAELREAQWHATKVLPKVGMAVITDVGEERDIHPRKKGPVGERLALAARALAYGEKIEYSGPLFKSARFDEGEAVLKFDHVARGLVAKGGGLKSFAICGQDRKWVWGIAQITGKDTITVKSPNVDEPVAVRFGWADYPVVNLWNSEGLPASPFRTDHFPMITQGKK